MAQGKGLRARSSGTQRRRDLFWIFSGWDWRIASSRAPRNDCISELVFGKADEETGDPHTCNNHINNQIRSLTPHLGGWGVNSGEWRIASSRAPRNDSTSEWVFVKGDEETGRQEISR